jgi:Zn-dependent protease
MFGRKFNILSVAGIQIGIDLSWLFIAALLSWTLAVGYFPFYYPDLASNVYWLMGIAGMLGLFVCILLHELGHALVAKYNNLPISQITLFIFGGIAEIKKESQTPKVEFWVAIAGPIVSVLLVLVMHALTLLGEKSGWPVQVVGVTAYLALINLIIVIFNMIPAFPLDGGRVFRALLWWWKNDLAWATKIASYVGAGFGLFLIFYGVFTLLGGNFISGLWMFILGLFLHKAATASRTQFYVGRELKGEKVEKFMVKDPIAVPQEINLKEFIDQYVYQSHHHLYPVVDLDNLVGYISLSEVKSVPAEDWPKVYVKKVMVPRSAFQTVTPDTNALEALNLMNETGSTTLLVTVRNQLVGMLTAQDLFKLISLKIELEEKSR